MGAPHMQATRTVKRCRGEQRAGSASAVSSRGARAGPVARRDRRAEPPRHAAGWLATLLWTGLAALSIATSAAAGTWRVTDGINLNARSGPGTGYAIVETLRSGAVVDELERTGTWSKVRLPRGATVFVSNRHLVPVAATARSGPVRFESPAHGWVVTPQLGDTGLVLGAAFSRDGRMLVSGSLDKSARIWEIASGRVLRILQGHEERVTSATFGPDHRTVATGALDGTVRLWDAVTGRQVRVLDTGERGDTLAPKGSYSVAFSPDGRLLATGLWDGSILLWNVATARRVHRLEGHQDRILDLAFSRDGRVLGSASADATARLWSVASGRTLSVLEGHANQVISVALDPDGNTVATGSQDGTARLWDARSGRELTVLAGHSSYVGEVAFSSDGKVVATGAGRGHSLHSRRELAAQQSATPGSVARKGAASHPLTVKSPG